MKFEYLEATKRQIIKFYISQIKLLVISWLQAVKEMITDVWYDSRNNYRNNILDSGCRSFILCMWRGGINEYFWKIIKCTNRVKGT